MVAGNLFQQMYNVADSVIVGNFVGADALGAVGVTSSVTFLFVALATGASLGASVVISQLYGAKEIQRMQIAIVTTLWSVLVLALVLMGLGLALCTWAAARALHTAGGLRRRRGLPADLSVRHLVPVLLQRIQRGLSRIGRFQDAAAVFDFLQCAQCGAGSLYGHRAADGGGRARRGPR